MKRKSSKGSTWKRTKTSSATSSATSRTKKSPERSKTKKPSTKTRTRSKPPTFADEVRAIVDRSHSVKNIKTSVFEFAGRSWDTFETTLREEIPIDEIPHIARAVERKFRSRFKGTVRTTYLGIERDEEGNKISDNYITLKSATEGGFEVENELEALKPDASGRYGTFKKLRFELKRPEYYGRSKKRRRKRVR